MIIVFCGLNYTKELRKCFLFCSKIYCKNNTVNLLEVILHVYSNILGTIESVAIRTNLLALSVAIEVARAGIA